MLKCCYSKLFSLFPKLPSIASKNFSLSACWLTHYDTLKLNQEASLKQIKEAYFKLSKECHPDLHPNDPKCHDRFIRLQEAYQVLGSADSKKNYDATLRPRGTYSRSGHSRPYGYPDFSQRDEWLRTDQEKRRQRFDDEFRKSTDYHEFSQQYGQPHKLTPEEMERFYRYQSFRKGNNKTIFTIIGLALVIIFVSEMYIARQKSKYFQHYSPYDDPVMTGRYRQFDAGYETDKLLYDKKYREYLNREIEKGNVDVGKK